MGYSSNSKSRIHDVMDIFGVIRAYTVDTHVTKILINRGKINSGNHAANWTILSDVEC